MTKPLRLAVLISGSGSNLQAIIDAIEADRLEAEIVAVISNNADAFGLARAARHGIPSWVIDHRDYARRELFDDALRQRLETVSPDIIVLAGFMRILGVDFIRSFSDRILNIHPSLLPDYKGLNTHRRVLDAGESEHGVSIHLVTPELDDGPIIAQARYPVEDGDSVEDLQHRGHRLEHRMYPEVLRWLSDGSLSIEGGQLFYEQAPLETPIRYRS